MGDLFSGPTVTTFELAPIEKVLRMEDGYVLAFNNRTFSHFMADQGVDIDRDFGLGSKAKRLRSFLQTAEPSIVARVLEALLHANAQDVASRGQEIDAETTTNLARCRGVIARLRGSQVAAPAAVLAERDILDLGYLHELATKTEQRLSSADFEGAITVARTTIEAVLEALDRRLGGPPCDHRGDLLKLYKSVAKQLRLDEERKDLDDNFKQVVRGLVQVVAGLAPLRNKMSDGHARERKPVAHHARVIVNAAHTVTTFLVESYDFQVTKGALPLPPA